MIYLEVAVAAPLSGTLTYSLSGSELGRECTISGLVGKRVLVPLGKRTVTGYILGPAEKPEGDFTVREIVRIVDGQPLFPENCVEFFRWVAEYYHHPLGDVIQTALPAGINSKSRKIIRLTDEKKQLPFVTGEPPEWYQDLHEQKVLSAARTKKLLKDPAQKRLVAELARKQIVTITDELGGDRTKTKEEICYRADFSVDIAVLADEPSRDNLRGVTLEVEKRCRVELKFSEAKVLHYFFSLASGGDGVVPRKELLACYRGASTPLRSLVEKGILLEVSRRIYRNPLGLLPEKTAPVHALTDEQQKVADALQLAMQRDDFSAHLLFGVTGGGKTEIYLRSAEFCLARGRDVLVLVPEIALATQLESQFITRFPGDVALLHSGLSDGERFDQWALAAQGKARIVIGARSAVFAPLANIGLIIVDEEHDGGFKQDDGLKYNGRDLAVLRGTKQGCTVLLGSATPSVTSYYNALQGKYALHRITRRIGKSLLPEVKVIDLNNRKKGEDHLSAAFEEQLRINLERGEQSIVLLNRRGFSASYLCQDCGASVQCRHCKVSLTYHKKRGELKCHYCGYVTTSKLICSNCCSEKLIPFGVGTERVEEEIRTQFPDAVVQRLDSDIAARRTEFFAILQKMKAGEIDILIGTQMIAKGHHFPGVTFVGVVWADGGLSMPDFRAAERTFQLLSQVTGRAGRGERPGRVIIQTMRPEHYAIECARTHSYERFYEQEIALRQRPAFPPFVRLAHLRLSGASEYHVRKSAHDTAAFCRVCNQELEGACEVLGPATAPLEMINNSYRWQVLLKSRNPAMLHVLVRRVEEQRLKLAVGGTVLVVDIDPENMM